MNLQTAIREYRVLWVIPHGSLQDWHAAEARVARTPVADVDDALAGIGLLRDWATDQLEGADEARIAIANGLMANLSQWVARAAS